MKKYSAIIICAVCFILALLIYGGHNNFSKERHDSNIVTLLYFETYNAKKYEPSTALLESGQIKPYDAYTRGFSYAVPEKIIEAPEQYGLTIEEWQTLDYAHYEDAEIFVLDNWRLDNTKYAIVYNGNTYFFPKLSKDSIYISWSIDNGHFFLYEKVENEMVDELIVHTLDLPQGEYKYQIIRMENEYEKPFLVGQFFCDNQFLYYIEFLPTSERLLLTKCNIKTNSSSHYYLEGLTNYFLTKDEILLVGCTVKNEFVIQRLDYDFTLHETYKAILPHKYVVGLFPGKEKMILQDNNIIYGIMTTPEGETAYFGYNLNNKSITDFIKIDIPNNTWLMDYNFMYYNYKQELIQFQPHVSNLEHFPKSVLAHNQSGKSESKEATADSQALEAMTNPDVGEITADATASESESSALYEAPTYSQEPADVDRSLSDEMTVRIVDKDGIPVRNIGVYVNHHEGKPMHASVTFAVSDNEGIAILQRLRTSFSKAEQVTLSLCDRNQSRQPQQSVTMTIPEDNVTPVDIVWDVPETKLAVKNTMTFHLDDNTGNPVNNAWFSLCEASETKDGDDKVVVNYGVGSPEYTTELHDWDRCTDENGDVSWVNLPEGYYSVYLFLYKPPFSNVKSNHPRLKQKLETPISNPVQRFYVTGEKEQKLTLTLP